MPEQSMHTMGLSVHGVMSWLNLVAIGEGSTWFWTDLDGAHVQRLPDVAPTGATHLWGWADAPDSRLWRVRLEPDVLFQK